MRLGSALSNRTSKRRLGLGLSITAVPEVILRRMLTRWKSRGPGIAVDLLRPHLQMLLAEVSDGALAPDLHKVMVQARPDGRADQRNETRCPLLHDLRAGAYRDTLNEPGANLRHELLLQYFAADVHARRTGRGHPQFRLFFLGIVGEAVDQAELLDHAQSDGRQDAEIGQHGENTTQSCTRAFDGGDRKSVV